jgi:aquaporin Z
MNARALSVEFIGTFALVLCGCGTAIFAPPQAAGGILAVALAFGLTVAAMAFAIGHVSGGHFNPAVTVGLVAGGRFPVAEAPAYIAAQVLGGIAGAGVLALILAGAPTGPNVPRAIGLGAAVNHFGGPKEYAMLAAFVVEAAMAALLLVVIMGSTSKRTPPGFAPLAIGASIAVFHLLSIAITNTALNPARATAPALFVGGKAIGDLWLFWMAPIVGAGLGGALSRWLQSE